MSNLARRMIEDEPSAESVVSSPGDVEAPRRGAGADVIARFRSGGLRVTADANLGARAFAAPPRPAPIAAPSFFAIPQPRAFSAKAETPLAKPPSDDDFLDFVARNDAKFIPIYAGQLAGARWRRAICWPAVFFPLAWLLYRKMYLTTAIVVMTPIVLLMLHCSPGILVLISRTSWVLGGFGRHLYVWSARRKIAHIRASARDENVVRDALRRAGGVSPAGAVIGALMTLSLYVGVIHAPAAHH